MRGSRTLSKSKIHIFLFFFFFHNFFNVLFSILCLLCGFFDGYIRNSIGSKRSILNVFSYSLTYSLGKPSPYFEVGWQGWRGEIEKK